MNKVLFSCITLLLLIHSSFCQDSYLGVKVGYNNSTLVPEAPSGSLLESRATPSIGLVYSYLIAQKFGLTLEPGWIKKGSKISNDTLDYKFHYLNMPILLDFYPVKKLKISLGPEIAYLSNATNRVNDTITFSLLNTYNNRWEFSGVASVSFSLDFYIDLGIRYSKSFTKVAAYDPILDRRNLYTEYVQAFILLKILN